MSKKSAEEDATKPAKASKPAKKTAEKTAKPAKPKYADMIAEVIRDCENPRVGVSRVGFLKVTSGSFVLTSLLAGFSVVSPAGASRQVRTRRG